MKCSICGGECNENQAFCLKCGNPIQIVPDFDIIEEELANSVGALMDDEEKTKETLDASTIDDMQLKLFDISKKRDIEGEEVGGKTKIIGNINDAVKAEYEKNPSRDMFKAKTDVNRENREQYKTEVRNDESDGGQQEALKDEGKKASTVNKKKKKKNNKKKNLIIGITLAVVVVIAIVAFIAIGKSVNKAVMSYDELYASAQEALEKSKYNTAIENAENALEKAENDSEKLEALELLCEIYNAKNDNGSDYIKVLEKITTYDAADVKYFKELAEYYDKNAKYEELTGLLRQIEDENVLDALSKYVLPQPVADVESGEYNSYIEVSLTEDGNNEILFTLDGRNPSLYGERFNDTIVIKSDGDYTLKAIAKNEKGVESKVSEYEYKIIVKSSSAPKVTPAGGKYDDYTKIKVEVPEGGKAYYTWDGSEPDENATEYTGEIDMLRKINILKVIVYDKFGVASEVAQESYNLQIAAKITLNDAMQMIENMVNEQLAEEKEESSKKKNDKKDKTEDEKETKSEYCDVVYEDTVIVDNDEYYIITGVVRNANDVEISSETYAVNNYDSSIFKATKDNDTYVISTLDKLLEEQNKAPESTN